MIVYRGNRYRGNGWREGVRLSSTGNAKGHANVKMALARCCSAMHVSPTEHAFARAKMHMKREGV